MPPRSMRKDEYLISEIFFSITGEGMFAGKPAIFVRFGECNLDCSFCDTPFRTNPTVCTIEQICTRIKLAEPSSFPISYRPPVVLTGGEPLFAMRHSSSLFQALRMLGREIHIETNGTFCPSWFKPRLRRHAFITCSPKKGRAISRALYPAIHVMKILMDKDGQLSHPLPRGLITPYVFIQPITYTNPNDTRKATQYAISFVKQHGLRLSVQIHKYLGIR